jgi:hypothetical protein
MRNKNLTILAIIGFSVILITLLTVNSGAANNITGLQVKLVATKETYKLGESVYLNLQLNNNGKEKISLMNTFGVGAGYLDIYIANEKDESKKYNNPNWGTDDTFRGNLTLNLNETISEIIVLVWNDKPKISDSMAPEVIKRATYGKIMSDYTFPESGIYYVKARYSVHLLNQSKPVLIESEPIKITIEEPKGEDLEVWNKIKDNGNFAYFIQEGDMLIPSYKPEERAKFQAEIERILADYPNSFYATSLSQSLARFRASEAKRLELMEKMKPKP